MSVHRKVFIITLAVIALQDVMPRTAALKIPEKIIGGVIDIVHSHKNKPSLQGSYPPNYQHQQGYPQYQQWNQNYQNGYQTQFQGQYQAQGPYNNNFPQGGSGGSNYVQGNYQQPSGGYPSGQYGGTSGSQGNYGTGHQGQYYPQGQGGQYQGQYQQGSQTSGGGGFQVSNGHHVSGSGQGPTCVCQAWTKPLSDTPDEKTPTSIPEKSENIPENNIPVEEDKEKPEA